MLMSEKTCVHANTESFSCTTFTIALTHIHTKNNHRPARMHARTHAERERERERETDRQTDRDRERMEPSSKPLSL